MSNKSKAVVAIIAGSILGGAVSTVIKITIRYIPPFNFSFIRFFIASICLLPLFLKSKIKFDRDFGKLLLLSVLPTLNIALFVIGVKTTTASIAQMLYAGTPLIVGILSYFLFGHKLSIKRWIYITVGLIGVFLVILLPLIQKNVALTGDIKGNILISLGVISWSFYAVYSKEFQKKFTPLIITSIFFFVATATFFVLSFFEISQNNPWWFNLNTTSIFGLLYVSLCATVGSYLLSQYSFKYANPVIGSFSLYLTPIFAYISAFFLLGEKLNSGLLIGTVLVFTSIALTTYKK